MGRIILVTGGAKSGKSAWAEDRIRALGGNPVYIATAQAFDDEMVRRIADHLSRRGDGWTTVEEPLALAETLERHDDGATPMLVDCLTLWLSNLMA
ncbi:bifunctional adenosylcobinamide kinase/adenosylcobinamide-phosphate guanylyltransferase, partial [uncultured Boseongicola sp.]|uniref:bifunctional adenosylcobinamide kinase/adenosylcobinamide-phosphate guanylyltransferase n=1 Tax=uncultured Boseongicola sp. TaxID=1648499 RepID=UPI0026243330